jgi:hypothetical protein
MAQLSSAIHGHSFHVEDLTRVDRAFATGAGLAIASYRHGGYPGPAVWVHAAIPSLAVWQLAPIFWPPGADPTWEEFDLAVTLSEVSVDFDASAAPEFHVANLHVWDGGTRIVTLDGLRERGPAFTHTLDPTLALSSHAVGLSFGLELPILIDGVGGVPPPPTFTFHQARASLIVERL